MSFAPDAPLAMRESVQVDELQGLTLEEAVSRYVGKRVAERDGNFVTTLRDRKLGAYGRILEKDRSTRSRHSSPSVAMLTLVGPSLDQSALSAPVDYTEALAGGLDPAIQCLRRTHLKSREWNWVAVRGATKDRLPHWHVVLWIAGDVERDDLLPAVGSFVRSWDASVDPERNPPEEAVKIDTDPAESTRRSGNYCEDVAEGKGNQEFAPAHPLAIYTGQNLPHVKTIGKADVGELWHGTIEWASRSFAVRGI